MGFRMHDKIKLQIFSVVCVLVSVAALAAGVKTSDEMYLLSGGMGLLGVALLAFAVARRGREGS